MKKNIDSEKNRLQQIILFDSFGIPNSAIKILKSDITDFLNNHFDITEDSFNFDITLNDNNEYEVKIDFMAKDIYQAKTIK